MQKARSKGMAPRQEKLERQEKVERKAGQRQTEQRQAEANALASLAAAAVCNDPDPEKRIFRTYKLQFELSKILSATKTLEIPVYVSKHGQVTHALIPATMVKLAGREFIAYVENLLDKTVKQSDFGEG